MVRAAAARARTGLAALYRSTSKRGGSASDAESVSDSDSGSEASIVVVTDSSDDDIGGTASPSPSPSLIPSESEDEKPVRGVKRRRNGTVVGNGTAKGKASKAPQGVANGNGRDVDIEDSAVLLRPHSPSYHSTAIGEEARQSLLKWFEGVRDTRGMPWRKRYDPSVSIEAKGQRAYEIWVSEVMLQQTQVSTVIDYWNRWIERWPTIADLAQADIEEVNAAWRGLGYYRRAKSLLEGAKTVMGSKKYKGRLPDDPEVLEKDIPGVGRYTAGAICSMAYGVRTPIVDGNIHRVLTRLLGVHAPQTAPATIKFLWNAAEELVDALPKGLSRGIAGDWNQALMELGATVCRPQGPDCGACPVQSVCKAYKELSTPPPPPTQEECTLCAPVPLDSEADTIPSVTLFPMRKEKKASRVEDEVVCITEWRSGGLRRWLLVKRPEKGLLAGLFEPASTPIKSTTPEETRKATALDALSTLLGMTPAALSSQVVSHSSFGQVVHIFSHINMTYHAQHLVLTPEGGTEGEAETETKLEPDTEVEPPTPTDSSRAVWLTAAEVEAANVGTGVKKVWAAVFGAWGQLDVVGSSDTGNGKRGNGKAGGKVGKAANGNTNTNTKARGVKAGANVTKAKAETRSTAKPVTKRSKPATADGEPDKVVRRVMMPSMPSKAE